MPTSVRMEHVETGGSEWSSVERWGAVGEGSFAQCPAAVNGNGDMLLRREVFLQAL